MTKTITATIVFPRIPIVRAHPASQANKRTDCNAAISQKPNDQHRNAVIKQCGESSTTAELDYKSKHRIGTPGHSNHRQSPTEYNYDSQDTVESLDELEADSQHG